MVEQNQQEINRKAFYKSIQCYLTALNKNSPSFFRNYNLLLLGILSATGAFALLLELALPAGYQPVKLIAALAALFFLDKIIISNPWRAHEAAAMRRVKEAIARKEDPNIQDLAALRNTVNNPGIDYKSLYEDGNYLDSGYLRRRMKI